MNNLKLVCHDVLQCSLFSKTQRHKGIRDAESAFFSFKRNMEGLKNYPVTLLCLGEGTSNAKWVDYIKSNPLWKVQSHGMAHRRYDFIADNIFINELKESKSRLESTFNTSVTEFYPPYRKFKASFREMSSDLGLTLDGIHKHPNRAFSHWGKTKRVDFHYWFEKDMVFTNDIIKYRDSNFIFIVGAPRSGTTALMRMLNKDASVALKEIEKIWDNNDFRIKHYHIVKLGDNKCLIDKNVRNTFRILRIKKLFPSAKFIFIYRNPYAAISSWRDWAVKTKKKDVTIEGAAKQYCKYVTYWLNNRDKLGNYEEVRYEQLCESTDYFNTRNFKWKKRLTDNDIKTINKIMGTLIKEIGYEQ